MSSSLPIPTLGAQIKAHVEAGDKAFDKAEQHYKAAGLHLIEAKQRLEETKEMKWNAFLFSHARLSWDTAKRYMLIADGTKTLEQLREENKEAVSKHRAKKKANGTKDMQSAYVSGRIDPSPEALADSLMSKAQPEPDPRTALLNKIIQRLSNASLEELQTVEMHLDVCLVD